MNITILNRTNQVMKLYEKDFMDLFMRTQALLHFSKDSEISVTFVCSVTIHKINLMYRGMDRPTDVISFAIQDEEEFNDPSDLGDIFINIDYAKRQAKEYGHSFRREVCFLFVHGLLHCLGYDHMNEKEEAEMIALQKKILDPVVKRK